MEKGLSFVQLAGALAFVLFSETQGLLATMVMAFLHCQTGSVAAGHTRRFHRLISSFLCKTKGLKSPVPPGAGFLGSLVKSGLRTESRLEMHG
jgi:hypothetical protein